MGEDIQIWMDRQFSYVNNPDKYGTRFVNQGLIDAVKDLKQYVLECKKKFQELKKEHKKKKNTDVHQLNNVNDQESVMTSNVNHDNEVVQSSRKRKRSVSAEEENARRGPTPRRNGYTVNPILSDEETYFYVLRYGETDVYKGGYATCVESRLAEINDTARRSLARKFPETHYLFNVIHTKRFETQQHAFNYEQNFFREIEVEEFVKRLDGEFYDIPNDTLHRILRDE